MTLSAEARSTAEVAWEHAKGQREPRMRGWQSVGPSNTARPAPVLQLISEPEPGPVTTATATLLQPTASDEEPSRLAELEIDSGRILITLTRGAQQARIELSVEDGQVRAARGTLLNEEPFELTLEEH